MFNYLINLFFPKVCDGCRGILLQNENVFCTVCRHEMPLTQYHLDSKNEAVKKFYGKVDIQFASAFLYFNKKGMVQELIHNLKYKGREEIGTALGNWYAEDLKEVSLEIPFDIVIPVPLHKRKFKERGYNQITTFGKAIAEGFDIPFNENLLFRKVYSKTQSKKDLLGRSENIESIFDVEFTETAHNKHFLIVDDVLTTGATIEACSRALLKIPGAKISTICIAMAH
ncbi:phosphoribosyltransferase family protein [Flavobacterium johnsoniae]|uniref:ComF family protein n=1 Tax=Flavobacterium johnsoniae TaxID=986 RepID=UPI0025B1801D|nr:phosphoribosyltransferase family protein [Flavobacterium johnsoniae]WJS95570.1 phosphoribosyltransferase family protein [Flavobacterium johnsoniae]